VVTYLVALHKPQAHHLPVAVVAPATTMAQLRQAVAGDAVDLQPAADQQEARHLLQTGRVVGVYLPGGSTSQLLVAGAHGLAVSQTVPASSPASPPQPAPRWRSLT
jgi:hypothetical protein